MADPAGVKDKDELREEVRRRYAEAARTSSGCCGETGCGCGGEISPADAGTVFGATLYDERERQEAPLEASLGCGNPTAVAELHEGEVVLDLGSGAGGDVLLSARRVGPTGKAYGLDMTDEMLELANRNADDAGLGNVEFLKGEIEAVPLDDASVDVVISNCVINLSGDKPTVLREAFRVLRPGGRLAVSDVVADEDMDEATRSDMAQWTGCIAGALTPREFRTGLEEAGFTEVEITETHRVHRAAASAIVRARKPRAMTEDRNIACSLTRTQMVEREAEWRSILDGRVLAAERRGSALQLELRDSPGLAERLARVVELEAACCPFLDLRVEPTRGRLTVHVDGPPEAQPAIDLLAQGIGVGR